MTVLGASALVSSIAAAWILGVRSPRAPAGEIASIAGAPFCRYEQERDQEGTLSDGLSEELLDVLAEDAAPARDWPNLIVSIQGEE